MIANPYLNFPGNTEQVFETYRGVFGGEFGTVMRFGDMPVAEKIPEAVRGLIMHINLPIGEGAALMGSDAVDGFGPPVTYGNNISISLAPASREEADRLFAALSEGGHVGMPMQQAFWGSYFGMCTDKFGVNWMLSVG